MVRLLKSRRFGPLFATQFLGAFNDNIYKNAIVILIAYRLGAESGLPAHLLVTLAAGIFILPFFLLSATAGELADREDKARLIRWVKLAEIVIMALGGVAFWLADVWLLLAVLFLMGVHSAFFGPLKYGILPDHVGRDDLVPANGLIEASTFIAIIGGTLLGGILVLEAGGLRLVPGLCVLVAIIGYMASRSIPAALPQAEGGKLSGNIFVASGRILRASFRDPAIRMSILAISWFWFVGASWLAQVPNLAKGTFAADETVAVLFLVLFAVGIAVGSLLAAGILRGRVRVGFAAVSAGALGVLSLGLPWAMGLVPAGSADLRSAAEFLAAPGGGIVAVLLTLVAVAGGAFAVPLYALIQTRAPDGERARVIAALNIVNAAAMVLSAVASAVALALGATVAEILMAAGATGLLVMLLLWRASRAA
nr:MFS transporter [Govania unica]